jgi:hypothetical protein
MTDVEMGGIVAVGRGVGVRVGVATRVGVAVDVAGGVGVRVGVNVAVAVDVAVGVGRATCLHTVTDVVFPFTIFFLVWQTLWVDRLPSTIACSPVAGVAGRCALAAITGPNRAVDARTRTSVVSAQNACFMRESVAYRVSALRWIDRR